MTRTTIVGGTEEDKTEILKLHEDYLTANTSFDWQQLEPIWSPAAAATFFNLNGHTYNGRDHWISLWKFYGQNVQSTYWTPFDIGGIITPALATIWCHRETQRKWTGATPPPQDIHYDQTKFISRSTLVFHKEEETWRVIHAHFSPASSTERPGGI